MSDRGRIFGIGVAQLDSVEFGHDDVEHEEIVVALEQPFESFYAVAGLRYLMVCPYGRGVWTRIVL